MDQKYDALANIYATLSVGQVGYFLKSPYFSPKGCYILSYEKYGEMARRKDAL